MSTSVAAVILAAGQGTRFGGGKQLAPLGGRPMLQVVVDKVLACPLDPVLVVLGFQAQRVSRAVRLDRARAVVNAEYASGLAGSLRTGVAALPQQVDAALVFLGDMPLVEPGHVSPLLAAHALEPDCFVLPRGPSGRGHPVLIPRCRFAQVMELTGDAGARGLLAAHADTVRLVDVDDPRVALDVDTPDDLERARELFTP